MRRAILRLGWLSLVACASGFVGCGKQDEVTRYTVTAEGPGEMPVMSAGQFPGSTVGAGPSRMLAAIVSQGNRNWFFKLLGPDQAVADLEDPFAALVRSVRFAGATGEPSWDLPAGCQQRSGSGMRFATVDFDAGERTLELTVIPLDSSGERDAYILSNVNRWRGQIGLAPVDKIKPEDDADPSGGVRQFELSDGTPVTMVNLVGPGQGGPVGNAGFDMAMHPPIGGAALDTIAAGSDAGFSLTYETPEGWSPGSVSGMRRAAFEVEDGERKLEITVISLPQSGGDRLANVNRWRKQIKLDDTTEARLADEMKKIPLAEASGDYVELVGPAEAEPRQSIVGVLADVAGSTWFFKMMGDAALAEQQRERFQDFIRSVRIAPTSDAGVQ